MNRKAIITICIAVLVIVAIAAAYFVFSNSDYSVYSGAFKKTFKSDSIELNTSVKADTDSSSINSTGNFKLTGMNTTPQFINIMTIGGQTITQFSDGEYIYTDDGQSKNKIQMGEGQIPQERQEKENSGFSYDAYISEFSSLLDATKIKELNSLEPVAEKYVDKIASSKSGDSRTLEVTLLPAAVDELVSAFLNENLSDQSLAPEVAAKEVIYTVTVSSGYISEIAFKLTLNVTAPGETDSKEVTVDFKITPVNPGEPVSFTLPETDGF